MTCEHCGQEVKRGKRTQTQNGALHLFFTLLANALNDAGLEMRKVLKPSYEIWWTPESIKEHLWRPIQKTLYGKTSATELKKHGQIDEIHKILMRELGGKFGVEYIDFPHLKEGEKDKEGKIKLPE